MEAGSSLQTFSFRPQCGELISKSLEVLSQRLFLSADFVRFDFRVYDYYTGRVTILLGTSSLS